MAKAVAKVKGTAVAAAPAYIKKGGGRGNEAVQTSDVIIPRIEVVQALSPCLKKQDPAFIAGSEVGDLFNSVTRKLYGPSVTVIPVLFTKEYLVWRDRKKGGGFRGAHPTVQEANARIAEEQKPEEFEAMETAQQLVLVVNEDGTTDEAVISMSRTKLKVSRQWNSLIRLNGGDRFSRAYTLFSTDDSNANGDDFKNFGIQLLDFPTEAQYKAAEKLYESIKTGARKVEVDRSVEGTADAAASTDY
jgi:hypothetical protein